MSLQVYTPYRPNEKCGLDLEKECEKVTVSISNVYGSTKYGTEIVRPIRFRVINNESTRGSPHLDYQASFLEKDVVALMRELGVDRSGKLALKRLKAYIRKETPTKGRSLVGVTTEQ